MEITGQVNIFKVISTVFLKLPISMKSEYGSTPIKILDIEPNQIICSFPEMEFTNPKVNFVANSGDKIFVCELEYQEKQKPDHHILKPIKVMVKDEKRSGKRFYVNNIHITNIINQNDVTKFLSDDKIQTIIKENSPRLKHIFSLFQIHINERHDERMRLMHSYNKPIFIPNRFEPDNLPPGFVPYVDYAKTIKKGDDYIKYTAEICIPIKYREFSTIGYVQVLNEERLDLNSFNLLNLIASTIKKEINDYHNYEESRDKCKVLDLSQSDFSFLHPPNRHFNKIFYVGDVIIFDMIFENFKHTFRAAVRNIRTLEKEYRIGCQFNNLNLDQLEIIESQLEKYKKLEQ